MVRLRGVGAEGEDAAFDIFQFQNGAIERDYFQFFPPYTDKFQFQNGAIERSLREYCKAILSPFQFQNGAIESR